MTDSALTLAPQAGFLTRPETFDHLWRVATAFSRSGMVPPHFQGKPESCMVALMYSEQLGEHPMTLFQEVSVINGRPNTSARFAIARANKSGLLASPITWTAKGTGDNLEVTARTTLSSTGEEITATVTMKEAAADGWTRNTKYKSIPGQMLRWRSATRLINLYLPEVLFGLGVREESEVQKVQVADATPAPAGDTVAQLNAAIEKKRNQQPEPVAPSAPEAEQEPEQAEILDAEDYLEAPDNDA
jgi:hypothetical protein